MFFITILDYKSEKKEKKNQTNESIVEIFDSITITMYVPIVIL